MNMPNEFQEIMEKKDKYIAEQSYKSYSETTNNKNFMGKEMPKFDELPPQIQKAWIKATQKAIEISKQF